MEFYQQGPGLQNTYESDPYLKKWFESRLSLQEKGAVFAQLKRCGEKAVTSWLEASEEAVQQEPRLVSFDPWGKRIDEIHLSTGWKFLEAEAAREGIVATAYERQLGPLSRPYQMALLYLFHSSSAFVSCPLAMTDGAARCLELLGTEEMRSKAFKNLTTRDPEKFWTSGQWMTERTGGSDVSGTSTHAIQAGGANFKLHGTKWFTSATTSQMSLLLARTDDSATLSLFYTELRDENGRLNQIEVHRLKDKLGTRALPTAELSLKGTPAIRIGDAGQGIKNISTLLNVTRVYNSVCATSHMRRALDLLNSYSEVRSAFGKKLKELPLHIRTLQSLEKSWQRCFAFTFRIGELLGREETRTLTADEKAELRAMTPVLKLYTAKECLKVTSEVCEGFGGAGYIEDTGLPRLLRDAQVFSIWEGTTNVLSLDFLRALKKEAGALDWFRSQVELLTQMAYEPGDFETPYHQAVLRARSEELIADGGKGEGLARDLTLSLGFLFGQYWAAKIG